MIVRYDPDADALFVKFKEGKYYESKEINENLIVDFDKEKHMIGFEILGAKTILPKEALTRMTFEIIKPVAVSSGV